MEFKNWKEVLAEKLETERWAEKTGKTENFLENYGEVIIDIILGLLGISCIAIALAVIVKFIKFIWMF